MKRTSLRSSRRFLFALSAVSLFLAVVPLCSAGISEDVHAAVVQNRLDWAEAALKTYVAQHGQTPEYLDALSWLARGYLNGNQPDRAQDYAKQIEVQARQQLLKRQLDTEPHLPNALGAAIEVEAQVLVSRGQRAQAIAVLHSNLARYRATSIRARLQKNLNLLSLTGQPAPPLNIAQYLGPKPNDLSALKGSPVLLFFWAHWCADCKSEGPVITQLRTEFGPKGLTVVAPTQLYGYAAQGEPANPQPELAWIDRVWQHFYPGLTGIPVPISTANFNNYGCSTTPTLVLLDRSGRVALYHPGVLPYEALRTAVEKTFAN
jgi:thiol-disulfide isomerase/thioredoxin